MNRRVTWQFAGATTVEFAIVAAVFFVLTFGVIEFDRAWFAWETLNDAARRGVRVAVVCPVNHSAIARVTVFNNPDGSGSPVVAGLTTDNVSVDYLDAGGIVIADPVTSYYDIRYVRVRISGYRHRLLIPFFMQTITAPPVDAVLPRESLGVPREGSAAECFGTTS